MTGSTAGASTSLSETEQRLCNAIAARERALFDDLVESVAIPTGGVHREGLRQYRERVVARLEAMGAKVEEVPGAARPWWLEHPSTRGEAPTDPPEPIVIARRPSSGGPGVRGRVMIACHLDTVHDPRGSFREVTVGEDERYATGPGVVDMKGGIAIMLAALEVLHERGVDLNWTVVLNSDEERGSFESFEVLKRVAAEHDLGVCTEPALADGSLAVERMGSGQFMIEVFGKAAHAGREFEQGVSAVTKLGELLGRLAALADPAAGRIVNVGPLQGGAVTNAVPDYAACWGNVRYKDPAAGEALVAALDALATAADALPRVVVHRVLNRPAKPLTPEVQAFAGCARGAAEALGQRLPFAATGGVCDGNIMQAAGLPTIDTLGVRGGDLHRPTEFIERASLVERGQLLAVLLARVAAGAVRV